MHAACFTQWAFELSHALPQLTWPQARCLAQWTLGCILASSCGLSAVVAEVSRCLSEPANTTRQRLREFSFDAQTKAGAQRRELDVTRLFAPLLRWIVRLWQSQQLALVLDATTLRDRLTILCISVVVGHTAVPVAWRVVAGNASGSWKPYWCALLDELNGAIPEDWTVLVMADRGLYARWLFDAIVEQRWHPVLRINASGRVHFANGRRSSLQAIARRLGNRTQAFDNVTLFTTTPVRCTLLGRRAEGYRDPWLVLTDLPGEQIDIRCYGLRAWIEHGFKAIKSGCFHWERSRMNAPDRVERKWLVLAVALLYSVSVAINDGSLAPGVLDERLGVMSIGQPSSRLSLPLSGCKIVLAALLCGAQLPHMAGLPFDFGELLHIGQFSHPP